MMRHLLKLVWRRKRASGLVMFEIFLSFLVVFIVATLGLYFAGNYRRPMGFDWRDVWLVRINPNTELETLEARLAHREALERLMRELRGMPDVATAEMLNLAPYDGRNWDSTQDLEDGRAVGFNVNHAGITLPEVLQMPLESGRWFEETDDSLGWEPIVVSASLARDVFGAEDPIGRRIDFRDHDGLELRVVGVIEDFRKEGELSPHRNYMFRPLITENLERVAMDCVLVRLEPGTPAAFEEALVRRLEALEPGWTYQTGPLADLRAAYLREQLIPLLFIGTVAGFLLLMVALGLTGILWQNVTQRRQEIGLRRAVGAAAGRIHGQVLMELMVMTSLAVLAGLVLVLQLPALPLDEIRIGPELLLAGSAVAAATIYLLAALCGGYPAWFATRVHPVEALRSE